jgi:uncharacterized protein
MNLLVASVVLIGVPLLASSALAGPSFEDGMTALNGRDYPKAVEIFGSLGERKDTRAQSVLGAMYHAGLGVPVDYKEARRWYLLAAEQGDPGAQFNLGIMYTMGQGVPRDFKEARSW